MSMSMSMASEEALHRAKSLLGSIRKQGEENIFHDSKKVAEALSSTISLLRDMELSLQEEAYPSFSSSPDWKVMKALFELLTRLGILPFLSPGVGITNKGHSSSLLAAASAISFHLNDIPKEKSLLQMYDIDNQEIGKYNDIGHVDSGKVILFACVEAMSSFMWKRSTSQVLIDDDAASIGMLKDGKESIISTEFVSSPISEIISKFFLHDMMAAYLQLGYETPVQNEEKQDWYRFVAILRLNQMVKDLHVGKMIEVSFMLLNCSSPSPPPWLKGELGKLLSKLIMRNGGLVAVLQQLVGHVPKGNVELYDKVSSHLAKVPKSVAMVDEYFKAISIQLPPLLLCKSTNLGIGETSVTVLTNIYHTAVSLACKLFTTDTVLAKQYILQPIMEPLTTWCSSQNMPEIEMMKVMENELVNSLVQLQVLLTAGCKGSLLMRKTILIETKAIAPLLLMLHFQLEDNDSNSILASPNRKSNNDSAKNVKKSTRKGIAKGFLEKGLDNCGVIDESFKDQSAFSKLKFSLADVVMAEVNQDVEMALPFISSLLSEASSLIVKWPNKDGEVWAALHSTAHLTSPAMYLSRLLRAVENWPLLIAVMRELLHKILDLRRLLVDDLHAGEGMLRYMQDFEVLSSEGGSEALEHDFCGAASLVKDLLEDGNVVGDEGILELVFHMANNVLKVYRSSRSCDEQASSSGVTNMNASILNDIATSLERMYSNPCISEKLRQMSFTLAKETSLACKNF